MLTKIKWFMKLPCKGELFLLILEALPYMANELIHGREVRFIIDWDGKEVVENVKKN